MCQICGAQNHTSSEHNATRQESNLERFMNSPASDNVLPGSLPEVVESVKSGSGNDTSTDDFALWEMELGNSSTPSTAVQVEPDMFEMSEGSDILESENVGNETTGEVEMSQKTTSKARKVAAAAAQGGKQVSTAGCPYPGYCRCQRATWKKVAERTGASLLSVMRRLKILSAFVIIILLLVIFDGTPIAALVSLVGAFVALAVFFYGVKGFIFNKP